jgi:hypothetical protein
MEYREHDARIRLEKRLRKMRAEDEEDADESASELGVGKELSKRLASNTARHRMSLMATEAEAKIRLMQRLSNKKAAVQTAHP